MGLFKSMLRQDRVLPRAGLALGELCADGRLSLGKSLYNLYRLYDSDVINGLHEAGFTDFRPVHSDVMKVVDLGGTRLTDVAVRANVTKQAAGQVVKELEALGYVSVVTTPRDTRVRIVIFTERGLALLDALKRVCNQIDVHWQGILGAQNFDEFQVSVKTLIERFGQAALDEAESEAASTRG